MANSKQFGKGQKQPHIVAPRSQSGGGNYQSYNRDKPKSKSKTKSYSSIDILLGNVKPPKHPNQKHW